MSQVIAVAPRWVARLLISGASALWYWFWGRLVITGALRIAFRVRVEGREHEPATGPYVAAGNHASALDPLLIGGALRRQVRYMGKEELFRIPLLNIWLRWMGVFPVRRGFPDRNAIRTSIRILEDGGGLVMFPEGTRSPDGRLRDPEPGAAMIALRTGAPVLPVAVINSYRILPKGSRRPRFEPVTVRFGPPVLVPRVEGRLDHRMMDEWGQRIMGAIENLLPAEQKRRTTVQGEAEELKS